MVQLLTSFLVVVALVNEAYFVISETQCPSKSLKWKHLGAHKCYIVELTQELSWIDAVYQCFTEGGSLASFHSAFELQLVLDEARGHDARLFIGLRKNNDGSFQWVDKTPVDFTRWYPGEPNIDYEKCVEIYVEPGQWNDIECGRRFQYVCSAPKDQPIPTIERKACPSSSPDWEDFGGDACYIVEMVNKTTWPDALRRCNEKGGSLASFHSIEEISAVVQHTKNYNGEFHIGLRETHTDGLYRWTDGSEMDLDYWGTSSHVYSLHDNRISVEEASCGEMRADNGEWSEVWCGKSSAYVCSTPKEILCGGDVVGKNGILKSPNYPYNYGPNEYCEWTITGTENRRIFLNFEDFNLQYSDDCKRDYVEIRDGHDPMSPVLNKICGDSMPGTIISSGNKMKVIFRSNGRRESTGFLAQFEADICGSDLVGESGTFTSPNFPDNYRPNENCTWKITVPEGHSIVLVFYDLDIEHSLNCAFDRLEVREGHDFDSPLLGTFCGSNKPTGIFSSTNKVLVNFVTDGFIEKSGFSMAFGKILTTVS